MASYLDRAKKEGCPLVDGERVTFVWEGTTAPRLMGDFSDWEEQALALRKVNERTWVYQMELPRDAYVEYAYLCENGERAADPFNPRRISNGMGDYQNFFNMPESPQNLLVQKRKGLPQGKVTTHTVESHGYLASKQRTVFLYQPPVTEPAPLLVVLDGQDYLRRAKITTIVDNLIAERRMQPVALAMPAHGGAARTPEYACSEAHMGWILEHVLPLARQELALVDWQAERGAYGILGASMGGLMALYCGLRLPQVFGKVLSQSGAFSIERHEFVVCDLARHLPKRDLQIWMDVGRLEWLLEPNRRMHKILLEKGYAVQYREVAAGHNYTAWRNDVWRGLEALFPPRSQAAEEKR